MRVQMFSLNFFYRLMISRFVVFRLKQTIRTYIPWSRVPELEHNIIIIIKLCPNSKYHNIL